MKRRTKHSGFTLLELVLVMLIICTALAIAAPKMSGWANNGKLRNLADQFLTLTRLARTNAIADSTVCRIQIDTQQGKFWLMKRQPGTKEFTRDTSNFGNEYTIMQGGRMELKKVVNDTSDTSTESQEVIDFFPTGRAQAATITFSDAQGFGIVVACESPADNFRVVSEGRQ
jgi:type II secretion system protein H